MPLFVINSVQIEWEETSRFRLTCYSNPSNVDKASFVMMLKIWSQKSKFQLDSSNHGHVNALSPIHHIRMHIRNC